MVNAMRRMGSAAAESYNSGHVAVGGGGGSRLLVVVVACGGFFLGGIPRVWFSETLIQPLGAALFCAADSLISTTTTLQPRYEFLKLRTYGYFFFMRAFR